MVTREQVLHVLGTVADPEGGDLVSRRRVRSLVVRDDGRVGFALAAHDPHAMEGARAAAEAAVKALDGVSDVLAAVVDERDGNASEEVTAERPGFLAKAKRLVGGAKPTASRAAPAAPPRAAPAGTPQAAAEPQKPDNLAGVKRIIAVGSGKGGVGKSTVSANLAVALAGLGWRVGLVDADIFGPSVPILFGAQDYRPKGGFVPLDTHGIKIMSVGFMVDPAKAVVWRGPMVSGALMQLVRETTWGDLDALLIDLPPGTGDIQLSLAQRVSLAGAVVVTTPQDLALLDVRKATNMFAAVNVPILGMVENMSTFICPHCGGETDIFGHGGGAREAQAQGVPFLGAIPLTRAIRDASDAGNPLAGDPSTPEGGAYAAIAAELVATLAGAQAKPFPEIVFES
ncbi:Mrp/NBP35 family ATP-binding protein [Acuticoccus sp. I52.16.1]|uniref:Mrp/NBP35 family ATP-binding protein n=1 Tax=Acuticoccus sp. I52.16.1 TaxID=2928472 RepID=UPI001FD4FA2D|nr:Mrp/NBP35 family ATP-binding protein [Acuticoccus sp. I52.16.1]UOM33256.1 Mrp/NBP35 family ATP-binding protein [Acuticoccus sp. I52.16.1]